MLGILSILGFRPDKPTLIASLVALAFYVAALALFLAGRTAAIFGPAAFDG